jgi:hypothetical protein
MDKGKDIVSSKVVGCDVCCVEGFSSWVAVSLVWKWNCTLWEEPLPLSSCPPVANKKFFGAGSKSSTWVLQKVKEICHHVGYRVLNAIEASHFQKESA